MPPACRFTREQIVAAALAITRERGFDAVTARAIADTLHSSSKVIFSAFSGMDDLLAATIDAADAQYRAYSADFVRDSADPPYKAVGTAYIRFARNEPNLFHLLYMRDRRREDHSGDAENIAVLVDFLMAKLSLTREDATLLHIEMWAYVHGSGDVSADAGDWLRRDAGLVRGHLAYSGDSMAGAGHSKGEKGMNVYESIPTMEKGEIRLRPVTAEDEAALLRVYGDPLALPFFNSDNCHGDIFYYDTPEKMRRAMDFWRTSWEQGWFVRWAIALRSEVIGTVELCRREESPDDPYSGMGILRVDVGSAWEKSDVLAAVMDALLPDAYALLNCRTLMTKAAPYAVARVATLTECGFVRSDKPVMGHHGERFGDYWVREK